MHPSHALRGELSQFESLRFPRAESEFGGIDITDLAELDAFIVGYVSRVANGEQLAPLDSEHFAAAISEASTLLPQLTGDAGRYFATLVALGKQAHEQWRV